MLIVRVFCLLVVYLFGVFASNASTGKTTVTIYADGYYPPFSYLDGNELKGVYVDLVRKVDERLLDYNIQLIPDKWTAARNKVKSGEGFALLGSYFHGHKQPYLYPYSIPLHQEEVVLVCGSDNKIPNSLNQPESTASERIAQWPEDFKGKLVGNVKGYDGWLRDAVRSV